MIGFWSAIALASAPAASGINAELNDIYERIAAAAAQRDPLLSRQAYSPDAAFLDERRPAMQIGDELHQSMRESMEALGRSGAQARISYRVARRSVQGNVAIDSGYYRVVFTPPGEGASPAASYRKFLVTAERLSDGNWYITNDASLPSSQEAYERSEPSAGLKFDP